MSDAVLSSLCSFTGLVIVEVLHSNILLHQHQSLAVVCVASILTCVLFVIRRKASLNSSRGPKPPVLVSCSFTTVFTIVRTLGTTLQRVIRRCRSHCPASSHSLNDDYMIFWEVLSKISGTIDQGRKHCQMWHGSHSSSSLANQAMCAKTSHAISISLSGTITLHSSSKHLVTRIY